MHQTAFLARLLSPEDFDLVAMVLVILAFAQIYADAGISNGLIHRQGATTQQFSSLYWTIFLAGWLVAAVLVLSSPALSDLYREPRAETLVRVSALTFLVLPFGSSSK